MANTAPSAPERARAVRGPWPDPIIVSAGAPSAKVMAFHGVTALAKDARLTYAIEVLVQHRGDWHTVDGPWRVVGRGVALTAALVASTGVVVAGEWRFTPSASLEQGYSDNVDLDRKGQEEGDASTSVTGGMRINGTGNRLNMGVNYAITRVTFWSDSDRDEFRHNMTGRSDIEVFENFLFFNDQASVREVFIDNSGAVSGSDLNANANRETVGSFNAGPVMRFRLGDFANAAASYRYNTTIIGGGADDSDSHRFSFDLTDGQITPTLGWSLRLNHNKTITHGDNPSDAQSNADLNLNYAYSRTLSFLAGAGYEDVDDDNVSDDVTGITWNAGFDWRPSPKTQLRSTFGKRFQADNLNVFARYAPTSRTSFVLTFDQTLESSSQRLSRRLGDLFIDENLDFIDDVTGLPFDPTDPGLSFEDETTRRDSLALAASTSRGRNSYSMRVFANEISSDVGGTDEFVYGLTGSWNRSFSRAASGNMSLSYRNTDFDTADGREDDFYTAALGVTYRLSSSLSSSFSYNFTLRDSNLGANDLEENAVALRVSKTF